MTTQQKIPKLKTAGTAAAGRRRPQRQPGVGALLAAGSGTAMASVCAIGLFHIERLVGGLWSVAAVCIGGAICAVLARIFGRLSNVIPSGAALLAFVSRGLNRRLGVALVSPYLLMMLFLVGFEALIVGALIARMAPIPTPVGALLFLVGTWLVCRSGLQIGYRAQAFSTWTLFIALVGLSIMAMFHAADQGELSSRLLTQAPSLSSFIAAVGQALFLFMGFELVTSHAEVATKQAVSKALWGSVIVLTLFYGTVSLGFSCLDNPPAQGHGLYVPQLAIAEQAGGQGVIVMVALICVLASFSSFNGALLALSRFSYALAVQGVLPRPLAKMDPRTLTARAALAALLGLALAFTLLVYFFSLYEASIFSAAISAALVYAVATLTAERPPFRATERLGIRRVASLLLALGLIALAIGVIVDAGEDRISTILLLICAYAAALYAAWRTGRTHKKAPINVPTPSLKKTMASP